MKGWLKEKFEPEPGSVEWHRAEAARKKELEDYELYQAQYEIFLKEQAEAAAAKAEASKAEETQSDSANA